MLVDSMFAHTSNELHTVPHSSQLDYNPDGQTGLYVKNVQFEHEGVYRCVIRTAFTEDYKQGYLTVRGEVFNE